MISTCLHLHRLFPGGHQHLCLEALSQQLASPIIGLHIGEAPAPVDLLNLHTFSSLALSQLLEHLQSLFRPFLLGFGLPYVKYLRRPFLLFFLMTLYLNANGFYLALLVVAPQL